MNYIIIEDEMIACRQLQKIVARLRPDMQLLCILDTVEESLEFLSIEQPDLIFMDVELGDGTCFDIIDKIDIKSPVIFITAYHKYAFDAFRTNSVDYLLKPMNAESVARALNKLDAIRQTISSQNIEAREGDAKSRSERILIVKHSQISYLNIKDIAFFKFEDRYITAYTLNGRSEITEMRNINEVTACLQGYDFFQLSRGIIASIKAIKMVRKTDPHHIEVDIGTMDKITETVTISRQRRRDFLQWLGR